MAVADCTDEDGAGKKGVSKEIEGGGVGEERRLPLIVAGTPAVWALADDAAAKAAAAMASMGFILSQRFLGYR